MKNANPTGSFQNVADDWLKYEKAVIHPRLFLIERMIKLSKFQGKQRLLDFGTGIGEPGLTAAIQYPEGQVYGIDVSERMIDLAKVRSQRSKANNFKLIHSKQGKIPFADYFFSAATISFALEYSNDFCADLAELWRVLAPGGHLVIANWNCAIEDNPFQCIIPFTIRNVIGNQKLSHDVLFKFSDTAEFIKKIEQAGFLYSSVENVSGHYTYDSIERFWEMKQALMPPVSQDLNILSEVNKHRCIDLINTSLGKYISQESKLELPFSARILTLVKC